MPPSTDQTKKCGASELFVFIMAMIGGTACSICSKVMMSLQSVDMSGHVALFSKPLFQTFAMFVIMMFALVMHWFVVTFRIPFPGYQHASAVIAPTTREIQPGVPTEKTALNGKNKKTVTINNTSDDIPPPAIPGWVYYFLAIPAAFDLIATLLCMLGLRYLDVSIYQLLRGSGIIFVAIMKHFLLRDRLYVFQWAGVGWNVVSVILVGITAILTASIQAGPKAIQPTPMEAVIGVLYILAGAFVQGAQYVFEEKAMTMDIPVPTLLVTGMEGLWGTLMCVFIMYPIGYIIPGSDHGSLVNPWNTWVMFRNSSAIQAMTVVYFFAIFGYNLFGILVTYMLNSVWHAILDNFRPITIWGTDLFIFYFISHSFGEVWTVYSWIQVLGMIVLLYGTAVYNAPHTGSIAYRGQWYSFGLDFSKDYDAIEEAIREAELDAEWEAKQTNFRARRTSSSFIGDRSPFLTAPTMVGTGFSSPKI